MILRELAVAGSYLVEPQRIEDERGFFARTFCVQAFGEHGLETAIAQMSTSSNTRRGTLRGMHFQVPPHEETKLVRCTRGRIFDVVVDLRPGSETFKTWAAEELTADNRWELYVPRGCAHGFLTLEDDTEVAYAISEPYASAASSGFRWDDPGIAIEWPFAPVVLSERDAALPVFAAP